MRGQSQWVETVVVDRGAGGRSELCNIYLNVTVSPDIDYFERYHNDMYPTQPDHIRLISIKTLLQKKIALAIIFHMPR